MRESASASSRSPTRRPCVRASTAEPSDERHRDRIARQPCPEPLGDSCGLEVGHADRVEAEHRGQAFKTVRGPPEDEGAPEPAAVVGEGVPGEERVERRLPTGEATPGVVIADWFGDEHGPPS